MVSETFLHPNLLRPLNGTLMTLGLGGGDFLILFGRGYPAAGRMVSGEKIRPMLERQSPFLQWVAILVPLVVLFPCFGVRQVDYLLGFYLQAILTTGVSHGFQTMAGLFSGYPVAGGCRGRVNYCGTLWGSFPISPSEWPSYEMTINPPNCQNHLSEDHHQDYDSYI